MGEVWKAVDNTEADPHRAQVVIKFIQPQLASDPNIIARFRHEAIIALRLKSKHSCRAIEHGEHAGNPFIAMEFLRGYRLKEWRQQYESHFAHIPVQAAIRLVVEYSQAIAELHDLGGLHRDIKPDNLFVSRDDLGLEYGRVHDFGIGKLKGLTVLTVSTDGGTELPIYGTPLWAAPEQWFSQGAAPSDVWALGAVLYWLLVGTEPYDYISWKRLTNKQSAPVPTWPTACPDALVDLLRKALDPDPSQRHKNATEMLNELRKLQRGKDALASTIPVQQVIPNGNQQAQSMWQRTSTRLTIVAGSAGAMIGVLFTALVLRQSAQAGGTGSAAAVSTSAVPVVTPTQSATAVQIASAPSGAGSVVLPPTTASAAAASSASARPVASHPWRPTRSDRDGISGARRLFSGR